MATAAGHIMTYYGQRCHDNIVHRISDVSYLRRSNSEM